jgi:hypothetical protein
VAITLTPKQFKSLFGAKALADKPKRKSTAPSVPKKSGPELKYEQHLWELKLCGQVLEYKFQPRAFVLEQHERIQPDGKTKRFKVTYRLDFWVRYADDRTEYVEVKGLKRVLSKSGKVRETYFSMPDSILKLKMCAALYPEETFCLVFQTKSGEWKRVNY